MQQYSGTDKSVSSQTYFAPPSECVEFLERGELATTQFIRHYTNLAYNGLWTWTDPDLEQILQTTVGRKFFNYMGNLNMTYLDKMVALDLKTKIQYLDYPTECKLRNLLKREREHGDYGREAREKLRNYREFYTGWGQILFKNMPLEHEAASTISSDAITNVTQPTSATSSASSFTSDNFWFYLIASTLLVML
jgi:hypothetical protein